jgi:dTDP-4-amino-4,6-dideoxygalactose transaminase
LIPFNIPLFIGKELNYIYQTVTENRKLCGDGLFTKRCTEWFESRGGIARALLTTSCTHALETAAILAEIKSGDEVIMPSFTFVSTANAFVLRGAQIVFVDIRPDTMNMDEHLIEQAITPRTRAVVPVHYAGVACDMSKIMEVADSYNLLVIEDAAQGVMSTYKGQPLGTIGDFGCYSFHETKNYTMGEGGALLIRDTVHVERAEIVREKGTNRNRFFRGEVDRYSWVDVGSSYLPSELNAAYLFAQLEEAETVNTARLKAWHLYHSGLREIAAQGKLDLPHVPPQCEHNAHMYYIKCRDLPERTRLVRHLAEKGITAVFHYVPLHSSDAGVKFGYLCGKDVYTSKESERLLRLPLYYGITGDQIERVITAIEHFYVAI